MLALSLYTRYDASTMQAVKFTNSNCWKMFLCRFVTFILNRLTLEIQKKETVKFTEPRESSNFCFSSVVPITDF